MNRPSGSHETPSQSVKPAKAAWRGAETKAVLDELSTSLRKALADHQMLLDILLQRRADLPLELGELFEDASNAYVEMSESVSLKFLIRPGGPLE